MERAWLGLLLALGLLFAAQQLAIRGLLGACGAACQCSPGWVGADRDCRCCSSTPPADWAEAVARADLLWSPNDQSIPANLKATIGNGYLAAQIDSPVMYVAGIFNGPATGNHPSHRAAISSPLNLRLDGFSIVAAALDLRHGRYVRRSASAVDKDQVVEQTWYAHRSTKWKGLLVMQLQSIGGAVKNVALQGALSSIDSSDIYFESRRTTVGLPDNSTSDVIIMVGKPHEAETRATARPLVCVVVSVPPRHPFTLNGSRHFIASFATSLDDINPEKTALATYVAAMAMKTSDLMTSHTVEWKAIWKGGIELDGRRDVAVAINASLYYLISSIRADVVHSLSPGGLASNAYNGHIFWDCEIWMWPPLLMWYPSIAKSVLEYRVQRIRFAEEKARSYRPPYSGAMFPWESAYTGVETCPSWAKTGQLEQHISGDIALAVKQLFSVSRDIDWLGEKGFRLLKGIADFWVSRVALANGSAHINRVIPPDEYAVGDDSVYTNAVAKIALDFATLAAEIVGKPPNPEWAKVSSMIPLLFDPKRQYHPEFRDYSYGTKIKQADVVLLSYPLLLNMTEAVRNNDLAAYEPVTDVSGPAMTWGMHSIAHLENDNMAQAAQLFNRSFANVKLPFAIWTETPHGGATNFITGAGGFLQTVLFGYAGIRVYDSHLRLRPILIEGSSSMRVKGVHYHGHIFDLSYNKRSLHIILIQVEALLPCLLCVQEESSFVRHCLQLEGSRVTFPLNQPSSVFSVSCEDPSIKPSKSKGTNWSLQLI